jgi:hypothetical protein
MPILTVLGVLYFIIKIEKERHPENVSTRWRKPE